MLQLQRLRAREATCADAELSQLSGHSPWVFAAVSTQMELDKFLNGF